MEMIFDNTGTPDGLETSIKQCLSDYNATGVLIFACDANGFTPANIDPILTKIPVPALGGIFPAIFQGTKLHEKGTMVVALPSEPGIQVIDGLSSDCDDFDDSLDESLIGDAGKTMFVIADAMATRVSTLLSSLFNVFGLGVNYLGGCAGSFSIEAKPCVLTNRGLLGDVAVLGVLPVVSGIGVSHGMKSVSGPHKITSVRQNTICTLDWKPAKDRFIEIVNEIEPLTKGRDTFPVSKEFCIAVNRIGDEKVVRELIKAYPDGSILFYPEVKEGDFVDVMRASAQSTIQAAQTALKRAKEAYRGEKPYKSVFCFDCAGRWKFLGEKFDGELEAVQDTACEVLGAITMGEIANSGYDFLEYYNRTCVIGVLEE